MELGIVATPCICLYACEKGVEPMADCIRKLPGETVTARCDIEGGTTWHNNGACVSCIRRAREDRKKMMADRHAKILEAPANPVQIEEAEIVRGSSKVEPLTVNQVAVGSSPTPAASLEMVLRVNGVEVSITTNILRIERMLRT